MTGKKSTPEQPAAYYYNQLDRTRADTQAAQSEREKLNKYVSYWAAQKDRNYSDDEILGMIGWKDGSPTEKFKKDYPTLYKMEMTRRQGTPMELNSAEAVLASLIILGEKEQAEGFMGRFNWAPEFIRLNGELLEAYASAKDSSEVVRIQNEYIESIKS
jgi:hypothetical protein